MSFSAKDYLRALKPPVFVDAEGVEHVGRFLSHHQFSQHLQLLFELQAKDEPSLADIEAAMRTALVEMFDAEVAELVLQMPPQGVQEAMADFFASHRRPKNNGRTVVPEPAPTMVGTG